jgi:PAS domain S-box-containing protein
VGGGYEFAAKTVATESEFLAELRNYAPEVILADYSVPGYDGLSALAAAQKQCPQVPFIFVSNPLGEKEAIESLNHGATDYVLTDHLGRLRPAVCRALREREERRKGEQPEQQRHEAEARLRKQKRTLRPEPGSPLPTADTQRLVHELQVHQIELEMQNEELSRASAQVGVAANKLSELYDFAPVGYLTLDRKGAIRQVNLCGARLLGLERARLLNRHLAPLVAKADRLALSDFLEGVFGGEAKKHCEVTLPREGAQPLVVQLKCTRSAEGQECHAVLFDITERKQAEAALQHAHDELELRVAERTVDLQRANELLRADIIERKRAKAALSESEEHFRAMFDVASIGMASADPQSGQFVRVNQKMCAITGYSAAELLRMKVPEITHPEDRQQDGEQFGRVVRGGAPDYHMEKRYVRKDGTVAWVNVNMTVIRDAVGHPMRTMATIEDITERKRRQEELRSTNAKLQQLLSHTPAVIYTLKIEGSKHTPLFVSENVERLLGISVAESMSHGWWRESLHPEERDRVLAAVIKEPAGDGYSMQYRLRHKNGTYRWVEDHSRVVRDTAGQPVELVGLWTDITERRRAEEFHARLVTAVEQSAETILITDASGTILYTNPAFENTSGYTREEALGQNPRILKSGKHDAEFYRRLWTVLGRGDVWAGRLINKKKDGTLYEEDATISPVRDAEGKVVNYVAVKRDITHESELEAQLRQAQKMEAVGQLAGGVAHDFNNMLAVIRLNAELLLMDEEQHAAETREALKHVVEASERAANLTRQLLAFSRKHVLQLQPLMLNQVVANLTKMLNRVISENIDLQCHYAASLPYVQADTGMMEQVILNLVVNARDAMPEGGQLRVATEQLTLDETHARVNPAARAGEFVCLLVSDTGTGIAPEVLPRIFEPFFTTKDIGKGTGLGLATVYGIVQQHQGWIEVSSQVGEGSAFKVFLPAIPAPAGLAAAAEVGAQARGGTETILLVEDEHSVRVTTRRVLESKGYTVLEATSTREALELWQSHAGEIALLLTDIVMPGGMTGRDLADQLWGQRPGLKVIFMSGYSADVLGKGTNFIRRTKSHFVQKPSSSRALLETVRRTLDEKEPVPAPGEAGRSI